MITRWAKILALVTAFVAVAGIGTKVAEGLWLDNTYATDTELSRVDDKFTLYTINQTIKAIEERLWQMERQWGERFKAEHDRYHKDIIELLSYMSLDARKEYVNLEAELELWKAQRDRLLDKMRKQ